MGRCEVRISLANLISRAAFLLSAVEHASFLQPWGVSVMKGAILLSRECQRRNLKMENDVDMDAGPAPGSLSFSTNAALNEEFSKEAGLLCGFKLLSAT